jgi:hypothetical protein
MQKNGFCIQTVGTRNLQEAFCISLEVRTNGSVGLMVDRTPSSHLLTEKTALFYKHPAALEIR